MRSRLLRRHEPEGAHMPTAASMPPNPAQRRARPVHPFKIVGVTLGAIVAALFVAYTAKLLLVLFAGAILALLLSKAASAVSRHTRLSYRIAVGCVVAVWLGATIAACFLIGPQVVHQVSLLVDALPAALNDVLRALHRSSLGPAVPPEGTPPSRLLPPPTKVVSVAASVMGGSFDVLAALVVIFFMGIYGAAQPRVYVESVLALTPGAYRVRLEEVLSAVGSTLTRWLVGRLVAMAFVGVTTAIAFSLLHVPLALTLALFAGLLTFIAYLGAIISAIPPMLLAFTVSPMTAVWVLVLYTVIHVVEGYLLTPLIARAAVHFPPLLTLTGQVVLGSLVGVLGLTFSTPLLVVAIVSAKTWRKRSRVH